MALFDDKKAFLDELEKYGGVMEMSRAYGVTHGTILYYKRKWDESRKIKQPINYEIVGDVVHASDAYGRKFIFDAEDYEMVKPYQWHIQSKRGYVKAMDGRKTILLHRLVMKCTNNMVVDHINHDKSDNRKSNLRVATQAENVRNRGLIPSNTSGVTGVHWHQHTNKWKVEIEVNGKKHYLGVFTDKDDAVAARRKAEEKYFGEFRYKQ